MLFQLLKMFGDLHVKHPNFTKEFRRRLDQNNSAIMRIANASRQFLSFQSVDQRCYCAGRHPQAAS